MIADDVRRFVLTSIPSVPFLEAMLVLRASAGAPMPARALADRLYVSVDRAAGLARELCAARIAEPVDSEPDTFRYAPADAHLAALLDRVAAAYGQSLVEISRLIHSKTERAAQQFADAFRLRKER